MSVGVGPRKCDLDFRVTVGVLPLAPLPTARYILGACVEERKSGTGRNGFMVTTSHRGLGPVDPSEWG